MERIGCLGPAGSYSEAAVKKMCPESEAVLCRSFSESVALLCGGEVSAVVLPIENTIQGGVRQNLDLLQSAEELYAVAEYLLPIDHRLARKAGVKDGEISRVFSHEQALAQCSEYLRQHFPNADLVSTLSTAESLSLLDGHSAGIVGSHVRADGIILSEENISDEKRNFTHFLLVKRGKENIPEHTSKIFVCAVLAHRSGSLCEFLRTVASFGLNLTKIESRPIKDIPGEYRFFIEFEGDYASGKIQSALHQAEKDCRSLRLLGAY